MTAVLARSTYFTLQRLRHGVTPGMVREAARLLDGSRDVLEAHVASRLRGLHGPGAGRAWLSAQPLVERSSLRAQVAALEARGLPRRIERRRTSGSTGTPFAFVKDVEMTAWMDAAMWAVYAWHGIGPGDRQARFWGVPQTPGARARRALLDRVLMRRRLGAFDVSPAACRAYFHQLRGFAPSHAYGYPTLMAEFAQQCIAQGLDGRELGLRVVITTGEMLTAETRDRLGGFFGCRVANEYGCTESGVLAFGCELGSMHLVPVAALPEVVDEVGRPVPPGESGEVTVTDLYGAVMPLVRYRLHDRVTRAGAGVCGCGRALDRIDVEVGRTGDFIRSPDRGNVFSTILAYSAPTAIRRFRATQTAADRLEVDVLPGVGFEREATPAEFRQRLQAALGPTMTIEMHVVAEIPYAASGKLRYFVPLQGGSRAVEAVPR